MKGAQQEAEDEEEKMWIHMCTRAEAHQQGGQLCADPPAQTHSTPAQPPPAHTGAHTEDARAPVLPAQIDCDIDADIDNDADLDFDINN